MGMLFCYLLGFKHELSAICTIVIFSDSKLAISATLSRRRPITNVDITLALRRRYIELSTRFVINLQWIRGLAEMNGPIVSPRTLQAIKLTITISRLIIVFPPQLFPQFGIFFL